MRPCSCPFSAMGPSSCPEQRTRTWSHKTEKPRLARVLKGLCSCPPTHVGGQEHVPLKDHDPNLSSPLVSEESSCRDYSN